VWKYSSLARRIVELLLYVIEAIEFSYVFKKSTWTVEFNNYLALGERKVGVQQGWMGKPD
jgi:hypothetical protein